MSRYFLYALPAVLGGNFFNNFLDMKHIIFIFLIFLLTACNSLTSTQTIESIKPTDSISTQTLNNVQPTATSSYTTPPNSTWHIQYTGEINTNLDVAIYNLDLFDVDPSIISSMHARNIFVMCYFSAGSFENWKPDAKDFPIEVLGLRLVGWEGEQWLDIRQIDTLTPIMEARLNLAVEKDCDGVDPDNINGYTNETGFPLTYDDQLAYNIWLANAAHMRGLSIGLKNDIEQIPDLIAYFDWQLNEECFSYGECHLLLPFIEAGKPVFQIEYDLPTTEFCEQAKMFGFQSIRKNWELDEFSEPCN